MEEIIDNFGVIIGRNMLKIYAGIVTYNPDIELLKKNINAIYNQVEEVVIIDNGSENLLKWKKELELKYVRITIISNNQNCGIAKALNQICCFGLKKSYNWVLTLDQDSISPDNLVRCMKENLDNNIAVIAPNIIYKNNEEYIDKSIKGCRDVEWVITSAYTKWAVFVSVPFYKTSLSRSSRRRPHSQDAWHGECICLVS